MRKVLEQLQTEIFLHEKVTQELLLTIGGNRLVTPAEMVKNKKRFLLEVAEVDPQIVAVLEGVGERVLLHQDEGKQQLITGIRIIRITFLSVFRLS